MASLLNPLAQAQTCEEKLNACDKVIEKQDDLIYSLKMRNGELQNDNDKLSETIVQMSKEADRAPAVNYIALGFIGGVLTAVAIAAGVK